ncbi:MAG: hypothetical protein FWB90_10615, partial [Fibromonadales bacterium]|nr:hypothetical protein [Fibromonadales bacterium]
MYFNFFTFAFLAITVALLACSNSNEGETEISSSSSLVETPSSSSLGETPSSSSISETSSSSLASNSLLLNFTSDYATGLLRWMNISSASFSSGELPFDQDSKVFANGKDIFVLERKNWGATNILSCMQADKIG